MMQTSQIPLMLTPFAVYLYVLGVWHSGKSPRVVSGWLDCFLLAAAIWGLLAFGPAGGFFTGPWLGAARPWGASILLVVVGSLIAAVVPSPFSRFVIYNVNPIEFHNLFDKLIVQTPGGFARTLSGYENAAEGVSIVVESSNRFRVVVIEIKGTRARSTLTALKPILRERLSEVRSGPSPIAWIFFAASIAAMLIPFGAIMATRPEARRAFLGLFQRIVGR
jgi:hypothetical protein